MARPKTSIQRAGPMHHPAYPGENLAEEYLKPLKLSVTAGPQALGVSRKQLSLILNGRAGITAPMALRLAKAFGTAPELWLWLQVARDLWVARRTRVGDVKRLVRAVA
jgi:antitoxin HigA-1